MAIVNAASWGEMMARAPVIPAEGPIGIADREARALGAGLAGEGMKAASMLELQKRNLKFQEQENKLIRQDNRRVNRQNLALAMFTGGGGGLGLPSGQRAAGSILFSNPALVQSLIQDPSAPLDEGLNALTRLGQLRSLSMGWSAGGAGTAAAELRRLGSG